MNGASALGQLTLFLLLAFVVPGLVYFGLFLFFFPNGAGHTIDWLDSNNLHQYVLWLSFVIVVAGGLLMTAVVFAVEIVLRTIPGIKRVMEKIFPSLYFDKVASSDAGGLYIFQLLGQAVMHFNLATGSLIMAVAFVGLYYLDSDKYTGSGYEVERIVAGVAICSSNFIVAARLYSWGNKAINELGTPSGGSPVQSADAYGG